MKAISLQQDLKFLEGISSPSGMGKTTSLVFSLRNTVGCLVNALKIFEVNQKYEYALNEPRCEKTGLRGFRPALTQTGLYSHRRWLEA